MSPRKDAKKAAKRSASIDGIVSDGRILGEPIRRVYKGGKKAANVTLGQAAKLADGFHPMRQSPGGLGQTDKNDGFEALEDDPIILGEEAKKGRLSGKRPKAKTFLKHLWLALVAFLLVGGIYFGAKFFITERHVLRGGGNAPALAANVDINQLKGEGDGRINVLLLGIGGPNHDGGDLTDTIMLASIDPINHSTVLLSIPRDLWVQIPGDGVQKINAAYYYGKAAYQGKSRSVAVRSGLKLLDQTLGPIIGVPIHYHVLINFPAFREAVNAVGGVTVNVPTQLYDPTIAWENGGNPIIAQKGRQHFNGAKALLYVKSRETSSDFARAERQRLVMVALKDKVLNAGTFSNPIKVSELLNSLGNNVYTDFTLSDLQRLYQIISQNPSKDIKSLDLVTPPHQLLTTGNINGLSVVEPIAGLFNYNSIQNFVRNKLRDSYLAKENATVAVYNATDKAGLATTEGKLLKSFGYRVNKIDNSPQTTNPAATSVIDLTNGVDKYTRHYLEARFKTTAQTNLPTGTGIQPPTGTDFVIILGKDIK